MRASEILWALGVQIATETARRLDEAAEVAYRVNAGAKVEAGLAAKDTAAPAATTATVPAAVATPAEQTSVMPRPADQKTTTTAATDTDPKLRPVYDLHSKGKTNTEIATLLNLRPWHVSKALRRAGLLANRRMREAMTPTEAANIKQMAKANVPIVDIAKKTGWSEGSVKLLLSGRHKLSAAKTERARSKGSRKVARS